MQKSLIVALVTLYATQAFAEEDWERERREESHQIELKELKTRVLAMNVKPEPGRDKAPERAPPWCENAGDASGWSLSALARTLESAQKDYWSALWTAAEITCAFPKEKQVWLAVQTIEQMWINISGLPEAQALETFKARMQKERIKKERDQLCEALSISDEWMGEEKAFMVARRELFNCGDDWPMWADSGARIPDDLMTYLDANAGGLDEIVRLASITDHVRFIFNEKGPYFDKQLLATIIDQVDFAALDDAKVLKMLDQEPYKGNTFARVAILESLGRAHMGIEAINAEIKKKSSDADWKELLVTAPARGVAGWGKASEKYKDAIARSNEFERVFWGPSRKAAKGCWAKLNADFLTVAKTLDTSSDVKFKEGLSDPIASLLFSRLAACAAVDGGIDADYANKLIALVPDNRYSRGPRLAALYAAVDALNAILEDRTKFPITAQDFPWVRDSSLYDGARNAVKGGSIGFVGDDGAGIVKKVKKVKGGVQVTFASDKRQVMSQSCTETNKIVTFRNDGTPIYYRSCKDTGLVTVDYSPDEITIPEEWAAGVDAGAWLEFDSKIGQPPGRIAVPRVVYKDKSKKKVVNFLGLPL